MEIGAGEWWSQRVMEGTHAVRVPWGQGVTQRGVCSQGSQQHPGELRGCCLGMGGAHEVLSTCCGRSVLLYPAR